MNELDEFFNDTIHVIKKDGSRSKPGRAIVANNKVCTANADLDIEDGDTIARKVGGGREEFYLVIDNCYSPGMPGAQGPNYNATVRKSTAPAPSPRTVSTTFNTQVHGGSGIQIGTHNQMEVKNALDVITQIINNSTATPEEKAEAKGALGEFLKHPAVVAIVGGLASGFAGELGK